MLTATELNPIIYFITRVLIFTMIAFPGIYMKYKILILLVLTVLLVARELGMHVNKNVIIWFMVYIFSSVFFTVLSILNGNKDPFNFALVHIIEPLWFMYFFTTVTPDYYIHIKKSIVVSTLFVVICNIVFTLGINMGISVFQEPLFNVFGIYPNYGGYSMGFVKFTSQNISWLLFTVPFCFADLIRESTNDCTEFKKLKKLEIWVVLLGLVNALLSLRTAFLLGILIAPVLAIFFKCISNIKFNKHLIRKTVYLIPFVFIIIMYMSVNGKLGTIINGIVTKVTISFNSSSYTNNNGIVDEGASIRKNQIQALIETWREKPVLGWGEAANAKRVIRSESSGSYEITYLALLMQRGAIGIAIYAVQILWMYAMGIKIIRQNSFYSGEMFAVLVGHIIIFLANATNPYLDSFDRLLVLFYPLLIIILSSRTEFAGNSIVTMERV